MVLLKVSYSKNVHCEDVMVHQQTIDYHTVKYYSTKFLIYLTTFSPTVHNYFVEETFVGRKILWAKSSWVNPLLMNRFTLVHCLGFSVRVLEICIFTKVKKKATFVTQLKRWFRSPNPWRKLRLSSSIARGGS